MQEKRAGHNLEFERIHITIDIVQTYKYPFPPLYMILINQIIYTINESEKFPPKINEILSCYKT